MSHVLPESVLVFEAWPCGCVAERRITDPEQIWWPALWCKVHLPLKLAERGDA